MSGEAIFACTGVSVGGTAVEGATHGRISPNLVSKVDQGDASSPGPVDCQVTHREVIVEVHGLNFSALLALIGAAAANVVFNTVGLTGAAETITVTNVQFFEFIGPMEEPAKDEGSKLSSGFGIRGRVNWASTDTFATVISAA